MMKTLIIIPIIFLLTGCEYSGDGSAGNRATTKAMFAAFNQHEWTKMASFYAEPALFLDPSFGPEYVSKTREETAAKYAEMMTVFPDIKDELVGIYPSGDKITVEFISTGTSSDGKKFRLPIITVLTFKDGLIVKDATYYDNP
jgi:ketosteroid isomerase-like protein